MQSIAVIVRETNSLINSLNTTLRLISTGFDRKKSIYALKV